MTVLFVEPPPSEAEGGIDLAMTTVDAYLRSEDVTVVRDAGVGNLPEGGTQGNTIVHFHGLWQPRHSWVSFQCRRRGIPYVVSPHGMLEPWAWQHKKWKKRPYWYLIERVHLQRAHRVLATSALEANNLAGFVEDAAIKTIPLALTEDVPPDYERARRALGWGLDETILLYLSRIHPKKGLHLLLEALATGDANYEDVRMVIVGDGPDSYVNRLHRFADDNQCRLPTIEWEGGVWGDRKWRYMQGADLFCLPTRSENFGIVVLEACQVGTPVLTTTGTPWSILEDWSSGFAVTPDVASLQSAVREYLDHWSWTDADRRALAEKTRKRFDMDVVGAQYLRLYDTILNETGRERCDSVGTSAGD